jgi:hypothetical protein
MIFDHHSDHQILILFRSEWGEIPSFIAVSSFGEVSIGYPHHPMETFLFAAIFSQIYREKQGIQIKKLHSVPIVLQI